MSGRGEEEIENRTEEFQGPPDGYIRKSDLLKTVGAFVGVLGAILGVSRFFSDMREYVDRKIENERNERINQFNRLDSRIDEIRGRR